MKKIVLIGGGNSTAILGTLSKLSGYYVSILTRKPKLWSKYISFINEDHLWLPNKLYKSEIDFITSDPSLCIREADIIFLSGIPIHHNREVLERIKPFISNSKQVFIGTICAYGGFNWIANEIMGKQTNLIYFGTQLIPWCCGTIEYGKKGIVFGAKRFLRIATESGLDKFGIKKILQPILRQELKDTNFLASLFWPNNAWLHPPILYGIFENWDGISEYNSDDIPELIYADLRYNSPKYIIKLNDEILSIISVLSKLYPNDKPMQSDFSMKSCIIENYGEDVLDKRTIISCINTCKAFMKHKIPYKININGIIPIVKHKFFETDIPYGLIPMKDIALMLNIKTPLIDKIIYWNQKLINKEYLVKGKLTGKNINECVVPSRLDISKMNLL